MTEAIGIGVFFGIAGYVLGWVVGWRKSGDTRHQLLESLTWPLIWVGLVFNLMVSIGVQLLILRARGG